MDTNSNYTLEHYKCSDKGLLLPLINEFTWPIWLRAVLYLIGLIYCFLGIAIIADIFMCSIEKITSKTRKIFLSNSNENEPEVIEVKVWNDTVANLTLMALGSSAPEILLSVIEVVGNGFKAGDLGPSTIVGSAAFNLLIITAACIVGVPDGETRTIKAIKVFATTAFFSVFAYVWMLIILSWNTPDVVDLWEAVLTLVFFPICVLIAFMADKDFCGPKKNSGDKQLELGFLPDKNRDFFHNGKLNKDALLNFVREVKKYPGLEDEDAAVLAASKLVDSQPHSRLWYRVGAVRDMGASRRITPTLSAKLREVYNVIRETGDDLPSPMPTPTSSFRQTNSIFEFHAATIAVMEDCGSVQVYVRRRGNVNSPADVRVESIDGSAVEGEDYVAVNQLLTFEAGEMEKVVTVEIINDNQWEPDEEFFLKLTLKDEVPNVVLGRISIMEITILNDDEPGVLMFAKRGFLVTESIGMASIPVIRKQGADGEVSVKWRTIDKSAINGRDYVGGEGVIHFKHAEIEVNLEIEIMDDMDPEKDEHFEIELFDPTGGAMIGQINRTTVTITNDDAFNSVMNRLMNMTNANMDSIRVESETWLSQIKEAMNVNGGDIENATLQDYIMHFLTFLWKVLFSFLPPPSILGGWLCFFSSLATIGAMTALVGDLAGIFGCLVNVPDSITAITFVAAGTSLPDLFASKTAARMEKYADNAIGNVTGSNSVNVFLGLGLPWVIAAAYWFSKNKAFEVDSGALGFSVGVYSIMALISIGILMMRRYLPLFGKAELGGPKIPRLTSAIFIASLWFIYVILSSLQALGKIKI